MPEIASLDLDLYFSLRVQTLFEIFFIFQIQKKNSFRGNYLRKYGIYLPFLWTFTSSRKKSFLGPLTINHTVKKKPLIS